MQVPTILAPGLPSAPPDHKGLPDKDGAVATNFQESPQSNLLTESLRPRFRELYADQFCIGSDSGIYWRFTQPVLDGCKAPDWFLVPGVPPMLDGEVRRSYVLWKEAVRPLLVIEYVSGDGSEEHDATPYKGKFWVYELAICAAFYAIYDVSGPSVELYRLEAGRYRPVSANAAGRFPVEPLGIELGLWDGEYRGLRVPWLRAWDSATGTLLPLAEERAEIAEGVLDDTRQLLTEETERAEAERKRAEVEAERAQAERKRAEAERERAQKFADKLRALGIDPEA
jgi:Uma2 family endonuclease